MNALRSILLMALIAAPGSAYNHPLGSHAIREAYFTGSSNYRAGMAGYIRNLPLPKTGPHVAQIVVRTPFAQVIVMSHEHSVGYSPMDAAQEYKRNPDTLQVRIEIRSTPTFSIILPPPKVPTLTGEEYPYPRWNRAELNEGACGITLLSIHPLDVCFPNFRFRFSQGKDINPKTSYAQLIRFGGGDGGSMLVGADVWFVFKTDDIASAPFRIAVSTPDGQEVTAEFDLAALR